MSPTAGDVERIHACFGGVDEILDRRRAIYRLSVELADDAIDGAGLPIDVVDNPTVRAHLAEVLGGTAPYDSSSIWSVSRFVEQAGRIGAAGHEVRLASAPEAASGLDGALRHIGDALVGSVDSAGQPLVLEGSRQFARVARTLAEGIELAVAVAPELARDLLPHVALFAVVDAEAAGRLGSASVRQFPGLILLPEPRSPVEVAEALIHEGAHQKFFDLAMTRTVLGPVAAPRYRPPWHGGDGVGWPFEQCVAAFHAYCCLGAFHSALRDSSGVDLHQESLLPMAEERAGILGSYLLDNGGLLGADGQILVGSLTGREFEAAPASMDVDDVTSELRASAGPVAWLSCGGWTLIMQLTRPAVVLWAPSEAVETAVK